MTYLSRPAPSGLADVVDIVLNRGLVIDAYVRISLLGIELVTIDARVVIASVDTYLRFAEATNRLDLAANGGKSLPDMIEAGAGAVIEHVASTVVERKVEHVKDSVTGVVEGVVEKVAETADALLPDRAQHDADPE